MSNNGVIRRHSNGQGRIEKYENICQPKAPDVIGLVESMDWFRQRLGKFPCGANLLLSGDPGVGKSTLALQIAASAAAAGEKVLFLATEQSGDAVRDRLAQLCGSSRRLKDLIIKDDIYDIALLPKLLSHQVMRPGSDLFGTRLIVVDSLQGCSGVSAQNNRAWGGVLSFLRQASSVGISTLCLAHMTKGRAIAGPRTLEHACDATLLLRHGAACRALIIAKNRFGVAQLDPFALTINPESTRLEPSSIGAAATSTVLTAGPQGVIELEVAITPVRSDHGFIKCPGLCRKEVETTVDLLERSFQVARFLWAMGITIRTSDGFRYTRDFNLAIVTALFAALNQQTIPTNLLFSGDLSLEGDVRPPTARTLAAIADARSAGLLDDTFTLVIFESSQMELIQNIDLPTRHIGHVRELTPLLEEHHG